MNIDKTFFYMFVMWYFYKYGIPTNLNNLIFYLLFNIQVTYKNINKIIYPEYWEVNDKSDVFTEEEKSIEETKHIQKYEDKYLVEIRKLEKNWIFTEDENNSIDELYNNFLNGYIESKKERLEEITNEIINIEKDIVDDDDTVVLDDECEYEKSLEDRNEERRDTIKKLREEYNEIKQYIETDEGLNELIKKSKENARNYIINKRLDKLKNCYVIEKTPQGNVLMIYDISKESFKYYSDSTIPYRYLEVVGRKYVKFYNCRQIFIDMEEELKLIEEKWEKEQESRKIKEEEEKKNDEETKKNQANTLEPKKNVFAKFKSYNKDTTGKMSMAAPPKNSIPNKQITETKENEKILLKENANRYTYEGKFANFNFLQPVEKKVFNKRLGLSFADFKKMQNK